MIFEHNITFEMEDGTRYNTWLDWRLVPTERPYMVPPALKAHYTNVDASNGKFDQTTALTEHPVYDNRSGSFTFYVINNGVDVNHYYGEWYDRYSKIANTIHGQKVKIILDDDPNYYYQGRVTINNWSNNNTWSQIQIGYEVYPYKLAFEEFDSGIQNVSGETSITVTGSDMPISPKFTVTSRNYIFNPDEKATRAMIVQFIYKYRVYKRTNAQQAIDTVIINTTTLPFIDVPSDAYYIVGLKWLYGSKYISGYTKDLFVPNNPCTRGQFIQILYKFKTNRGTDAVKVKLPYKDVKTSDYFYDAVCWAYKNGYMTGTSTTAFSPSQAITRAQAVYVLWLVGNGKSETISLPEGEQVKDVTDKFDEDKKDWYYDAVKWAYNRHYASGKAATIFDPDSPSTRGQFFTILYAFECGHQIDQPFDGQWSTYVSEWKRDMHNLHGSYTEPTSLADFKAVLSNANVDATDSEASRMWNNTQNEIYQVRPRTNMTQTELDANDDYCKFTDIAVTASYYYPALFAFSKDLTAGIDDHTFGPSLTVDRFQVVYVLWKLAGSPEPEQGGRAVDVPKTVYWRKAVDWAAENGITELGSDRKFNPNDEATRAMVVQFLYAYEKWLAYGEYTSEGDMPFVDIADGNIYYKKAVDWAVYHNITAKYGAGLKILRTGRKDLHLVDGENRLPQICVDKDENIIRFSGEGTVRIQYQRGSL